MPADPKTEGLIKDSSLKEEIGDSEQRDDAAPPEDATPLRDETEDPPEEGERLPLKEQQ